MDLQRGYGLDADDEERVSVLLWCHARATGRRPTSLQGLFYEVKAGQPEEEVSDRLHEMAGRRWVELTYPPFGRWAEWTGHLTTEGRDLAQAILERRTSAVRRSGAAKDSLLRWVYAEGHQGRRPGPVRPEEMGRHGRFLGTDFTAEEITRAARYLCDEGLTIGVRTSGPDILRLHVTSQGERFVEQDRSVNDPDQPTGPAPSVSIGSQHNQFTNVGQANVVTAGRDGWVEGGFALDDSQRNDLRGFADLLDALVGTTAGDPAADDDRLVAVQVVGDLRTQANAPEPDSGIIRRALHTVTDLSQRGALAVNALTMLATQVPVLTESLHLT